MSFVTSICSLWFPWHLWCHLSYHLWCHLSCHYNEFAMLFVMPCIILFTILIVMWCILHVICHIKYVMTLVICDYNEFAMWFVMSCIIVIPRVSCHVIPHSKYHNGHYIFLGIRVLISWRMIWNLWWHLPSTLSCNLLNYMW